MATRINQETGISRRAMLAGSGGLVLCVTLLGCSRESKLESPGDAAISETEFNIYLRIGTDGIATIQSAQPEIGQGVKTALPMMVAEELDIPWEQVRVEQSVVNPTFSPQFAGGSLAVPMNWERLRKAGAKARQMLVAAAAVEWGVDAASLKTDAGSVLDPATGNSLSYGSLAGVAGKLPEPDDESVQLKETKNFKLLGSRVSGVDNLSIVTGQPLFGIDQNVPGMRYASYARCPSVGGTVTSANLDAIMVLPGVENAFVVRAASFDTPRQPANAQLREGVAIIADSTYAAIAAKRDLEIEWNLASASADNWSEFRASALAMATPPETATRATDKGDVATAFAAASATISGAYVHPFVNHAPMEPQNCTAWYKEDGTFEFWAPTQLPAEGAKMIAAIMEMPVENITVHLTRMGGGFGRRLYNDFMLEAAMISKMAGVPVKLQWTREDDMENDCFRPGGIQHIEAAIDNAGKVSGWKTHYIGPSMDGESLVPMGVYPAGFVPEPMIENVRADTSVIKCNIPTGAWRAPVSNSYAFAINSFLHEASEAADRDFVEFYVDLLGEDREIVNDAFAGFRPVDTARAKGVIRKVAGMAEWGREMPANRALGLSYFYCHSTYVAEIADVEVTPDKQVLVHNVWVAADCGPVVNMSMAESLCQGGVIDGISTMGLECTFEDGEIQEKNFHAYPILRMRSAPQVKVEFIQTETTPSGLGEPGMPPIAAAVTNAIYTATGERLRELPISKAGYRI